MGWQPVVVQPAVQPECEQVTEVAITVAPLLIETMNILVVSFVVTPSIIRWTFAKGEM